MEALARIIINRTMAWAIVLLTVLVSAGSLYMAQRVEHEDDVLAFLPQDNPEVQLFKDINKRFGGLDLALVGIQAKDGALDPGFLTRLRKVTDELKETRGLDHVLSLANIVDFTPDEEQGGIITSLLISDIPKSAAQQKILTRKVMSREHVVGNLIAEDAKAVLVYCYLAYGSNPMAMAGRIKEVVRKGFPEESRANAIYWGGGPFVSTYIYETSQKDVHRLTPWAVLVIVVIMILAFRDIIGSCVVLLSTGMGIVISMGCMAALGVRFNIVLGSMPVILFAIGSAYGIHVLARYYTLTQNNDVPTAIMRTMTGVGPTVLAAGCTTAASLLSFIWMDIRPLRTFGLFTALGILITLVLSLTFIPAVAGLIKLKRKQKTSLTFRRLLTRVTVFAQAHRLPVGVALGLVAAAGLVFTARVDTRMDNATFFSKGSPPDRAEKFLADHFGGSQFIQLHVEGDMTDPAFLRELQGLAAEIALMPHVSSVLHVGQAVARVNDIMVGQNRIPDTPAQVKLLYSFLAGDPSVAQLVNASRDQALMHVKVGASRAKLLEPLILKMESRVAAMDIRHFTRVKRAGTNMGPAQERIRRLILGQLKAQAHLHRLPLSAEALQRFQQGLEQAGSFTVPPALVTAAVVKFLRSDECAAELPAEESTGAEEKSDPAQTIAAAVTALGPAPSEEALTRALKHALKRDAEDDLVQDLVMALAGPLDEIWRIQRAAKLGERLVRDAGLKVPADDGGQRFLAAVKISLMDLDVPSVLLPATPTAAAGTLKVAVNGLPVMHRGLSRSVTQNQIKSLAFALVLVVLIMSVLFRSLWSGLLVSTPTLLTLTVIYGGMGLFGVHLDIGTSMLACLILGAGVDYAVHLAAAWHSPADGSLQISAAQAADHAGPAIWTNAIMVCAGFFVLTLGEARPLQNVGGLTAAAMITAATATFLTFPVLARRLRYSRNSERIGLDDTSEALEPGAEKSDILQRP